MSKFSGRADLYDYVYSTVQTWDDYFQAFDDFKKKTKGKIYQYRKILVTEDNRDYIKSKVNLSYSNYTKNITDNNGVKKEILETSYLYQDIIYPNIKALNKHGVYIPFELPFDTVFDLIPYYPYTISSATSNENSAYIVVADKSSPEDILDERLMSGSVWNGSLDFYHRYNHALTEHFKDVVPEWIKNI